MADFTTAGRSLAGRRRVRAETEAGAEYRTFPPKAAASLTMIGAAICIVGSLGASIRAAALASARDDPKQVAILMGYEEAVGWLLAAGSAILAVSGLAWLGRRIVPKLVAVAVTLAFGVGVAGRLLALDERAAAWAQAARRQPEFLGYHAGLGWGAWLLLVGAIICGFGLLTGLLREIDRRKGIAS